MFNFDEFSSETRYFKIIKLNFQSDSTPTIHSCNYPLFLHEAPQFGGWPPPSNKE